MRGRAAPAPDSGQKQKREYSKQITLLVVLAGIVITQECLAIMVYAIRQGFTSTAAYLTAAVGLAEAVIGAGVSGYLSLAKSDHSEGGITFEVAKAKDFSEDGKQSPPV